MHCVVPDLALIGCLLLAAVLAGASIIPGLTHTAHTALISLQHMTCVYFYNVRFLSHSSIATLLYSHEHQYYEACFAPQNHTQVLNIV